MMDAMRAGGPPHVLRGSRRWPLALLLPLLWPLAAYAAAPEPVPTPAVPAAPVPPHEQRAAALVLLDGPANLDAEEVLSEYIRRWRSPARVISSTGVRVLVDLGDALGIFRLNNEPVNEWLLDKAVHATWQWAGAARVVHNHRAHVAVEVRSPRGDGIANARRLTRLVASLLAVRPARAVLWTGAQMLVEPSRFVADAETLTTGNAIPTSLWLNFLPAALSPHLPVVHTLGLAQLGYRELVLFGHRSGPQSALQTLTQLAERLLQGRLSLRPGDSIRTDSRDTLVVEEIPAPWDENQMAYQLTPGPPAQRR